MSLCSFADKNVLVLGLGASGYAAAELALRYRARVTVVDSQINAELETRAQRLFNRGASIHLDWNKELWNDPVDFVITSPGIFPKSPLLQMAYKLSCPVISELEFGFNHCSCPILAVTGTNGKTTTVELVVHCLRGIGYKALAAGNIGLPLSEASRKSAVLDYIVVEASSFQLETILNFTPLVAAILNITEDHMDRYGSYLDYANSKFRLVKNLPKYNNVIMKHEIHLRRKTKSHFSSNDLKPITFSSQSADRYCDYHLGSDGYIYYKTVAGHVPLLNTDELKLRGKHNIENVEAALAICNAIGIPHSKITPLLGSFVGRAHRQELVAVCEGVKYINDSKSTNPDALLQALIASSESLEMGNGRIILIAGGRDKKMNFRLVIPAIRSFVKEIYLIGESRDLLWDLWNQHALCRKFTSLDAAVLSAIENSSSGDIVLFSPGCASQDMFENYEERGNYFTNEVKRRLEK